METTSNEGPLKDPTKLFYQAPIIRRKILSAYWIVILLAVPLWWRLTSITRLALPTARVLSQKDQQLLLPISISLDLAQERVEEARQHLQQAISADPNRWQGLEVAIEPSTISDAMPNKYNVKEVHNSEPQLGDRSLAFPLNSHPVSELVEDLVTLLAAPPTIQSRQNRAAVYSPRYRLAFTLLNEDASAGYAIDDWDVVSSIDYHIRPLLDTLSVLHNFTIESQIQLHAPLAFQPENLGDQGFGLTPEHLTVFINSAQWTLSSSVSNDPVLHFVLFIPSASRQPLHILDAAGSISPSSAFLLPQWGGIVLYNPSTSSSPGTKLTGAELDSVFTAFSRQLQILLGVNPLPSGLRRNPEITSPITGWQLDELIRRRTLENTRESQATLSSIVRLVDQIENMPVGEDVLDDVQDSLSALETLFSQHTSSLKDALQASAKALTLSSRAFFNPGMLALLYFPAEHKYAVYTPLFASAVIPLVVAALREIAAWRRERKGTAQAIQ